MELFKHFSLQFFETLFFFLSTITPPFNCVDLELPVALPYSFAVKLCVSLHALTYCLIFFKLPFALPSTNASLYVEIFVALFSSFRGLTDFTTFDTSTCFFIAKRTIRALYFAFSYTHIYTTLSLNEPLEHHIFLCHFIYTYIYNFIAKRSIRAHIYICYFIAKRTIRLSHSFVPFYTHIYMYCFIAKRTIRSF